jgi:hypothetical protein
MCHYYKHLYTCSHMTHAFAKYCSAAGLVQTECKKKNIWQTIKMGEACEDCGVPTHRGGDRDVVGGDGMQEKKSLIRGKRTKRQ